MVLTQISCMKPAGGAADVENDCCFQINMNGINPAGITVISVRCTANKQLMLTIDLQVSSDLRRREQR